MTIRNCRFIENTAGTEGAVSGGAIYAGNNAVLTIDASTFEGNKIIGGNGGAVYIGPSGTLNLTNSTFEGNSTSNRGGAIYAASSAVLGCHG